MNHANLQGAITPLAMLTLLFTLTITPGPNAALAGQDGPVRLSGAPVAETLPLVALAMDQEPGKEPAAPGLAFSFAPWHSPDQLRAMIVGGQVDAALVTVAAAARLAERGVPVRVVVVLAPVGWILSARGTLPSMDGLRGEEILLPFGPGEMPEVLFTTVAAGHGLVRDRDYTLHNGANAMEVAQHLLLGHADFAFVSEPAASLAVVRSTGSARPLVKALDIRVAWAQAFPACPELATTALVLFGPRAADEALAQRLGRAFRRVAARIPADPGPVMVEAGKHFPEFATAPDAWTPLADMHVLDDAAAEDAVRFHLDTLRAVASAMRVGHLPHEAFSHVRHAR